MDFWSAIPAGLETREADIEVRGRLEWALRAETFRHHCWFSCCTAQGTAVWFRVLVGGRLPVRAMIGGALCTV